MGETAISEELFQLLNGKELHTKQHEAMMLQTVTEEGWPHTAMVSVGEVVALDRITLRLALWPGTTTSTNMIRTGKALLAFCYRGKAHYIRLSLQRLPALPHAKYPRERFEAKVAAAKEDTAKYADITSGIQIELKDAGDVIRRWEETLEELRR